jgi:hypothetical protein
MNLQDLMDQAWDLACEQMAVEDADNLSPSEFQSLNDLQTRIFEKLGGDLDKYYEVAQ